jgi:phosphotransferase system enzyme I (PtsI)
MADKKQVILMKGIGVSSGIIIGRAYLLDRGMVEPAYFCYLDPKDTDREIKRFEDAIDLSRVQLESVRSKMETDGRGKEHIHIIDAHLMILQDQMLISDTLKVIREDKVNAEWALDKVLKGLKEFFAKIDDEYFRERSSDIEHIVNRVLMNLMGKKHESITDVKDPSIVIAHDLSPTDTAQMDKARVLAFLTDVGTGERGMKVTSVRSFSTGTCRARRPTAAASRSSGTWRSSTRSTLSWSTAQRE